MYKNTISYFFNHVKHMLIGADNPLDTRSVFLTANGKTTVLILQESR